MALFGRKIIYTDEKEITDENVTKVLADAYIVHLSNVSDMEYLLKYEKGDMPIRYRTKDIRPEINTKVVDNMASEITDFRLGYEWGSPITYVQRAKNGYRQEDAEKDNYRISALNEMMEEECKAAKDQELARYIEICGVGYRMIKPKMNVIGKSVFDIITLNPLTTFIVYSNDIYRKPMMAVTYFPKKNGECLYGVYTDTTYYEIESRYKIVNKVPTEKVEYTVINGDGGKGIMLSPQLIPIVEYVNDYDRMGCFEKVISEIDALNIVQSDRVNDIVQCVQSMVWGHNIDLDKDADGKIKTYNGMWIMTKGNGVGQDAKLQYLSKEMSQDGIQTLSSNLTSRIREITATPGSQNNSGGSTGSAVTLSNLWQNAENMARKKEQIIKQSEMQMLKIILEIFRKSVDVEEDLSKLQLSDIEIKPNRNKTYDLSTKANAISTLISKGFDPLKVLDAIPFFADPQQTINDSQDRIDRLLFTEKVEETKMMADYSDQPDKLEYGDTE